MRSIVWRAATALTLGLATTGCDERAEILTPPAAQPPAMGLLQITAVTTGEDRDLDGYMLSISQSRQPLAPNGIAVFRLRSGTYELKLDLVNPNCTVKGQHPRVVAVAPNSTLDVTFSVVCEVVGYTLVTRTSGADLPIAVRFEVDGRMTHVGPNDSVAVVRQRPGVRSIFLTGTPQNCKLLSRNPVTVELVPNTLPIARFELACSRTEKRIAFVADERIATTDAQGGFLTVFRDGYDITWSPDGSRIAFVDGFCYLDCYSDGIGILDVETREMTRIPDTGEAVAPAWSPDGSRIAFVEGKNVLTMRIDGSDRRVVTDGSFREVHNPAWSPDGTRLVFDCATVQASVELCVINADGSGLKQLTENSFYDGNAAWSPDGLWIAFETNRFGNLRDIAVMKPDGTDVTRVVTGASAAWTPDAARILFTGSAGIFIVRTDGSELTRLTNGWHSAPAWRP